MSATSAERWGLKIRSLHPAVQRFAFRQPPLAPRQARGAGAGGRACAPPDRGASRSGSTDPTSSTRARLQPKLKSANRSPLRSLLSCVYQSVAELRPAEGMCAIARSRFPWSIASAELLLKRELREAAVWAGAGVVDQDVVADASGRWTTPGLARRAPPSRAARQMPTGRAAALLRRGTASYVPTIGEVQSGAHLDPLFRHVWLCQA
jgi:hypothetical protein